MSNVEHISDQGPRKGGPLVKRILQNYMVESANSMCGPNEANFSKPLPPDKFQSDTKRLGIIPKLETPETVVVKQTPPVEVEQSVGLLKIVKPSRKRLESSTSVESGTLPAAPKLDPETLCMKSESEVIYTDLEGEQIAGFAVGGEIRLCLLRILTQVLYDFSRNEISKVCADLHIYLASCSEVQLQELKGSGVLPIASTRCGLITKTDSERLCRALLHQSSTGLTGQVEKPDMFMKSRALKVAHECFGGCRGVVALDKYTTECAKCVQCSECLEIFAPVQFVAHCHDDPEHRACHWGFDPANWRSYIMLSEDIEARDYERMANALEEFKTKFQLYTKEGFEIKKEDDDPDILPVKRSRLSSSSSGHTAAGSSAACSSSSAAAAAAGAAAVDNRPCIRRATALARQLRESLSSHSDTESLRVGGERRGNKIGATLPPYLLTSEPVLVTHSTERANHHSDKHLSDPGYTPNVSLDPTPYLELRSKYPDLVHQDDLTQTALNALMGEAKGQWSAGCSMRSPGADDDVFTGADDDDDDDYEEDDDDEVDNDKLDKQSVTSDKLTCPEDLEHSASDDDPPPFLEMMTQLANDPDKQADPTVRQQQLQQQQELQDCKLELFKSLVQQTGGALSEEMRQEKLEKFVEIQSKQRDLASYLTKSCSKDEKELEYVGRMLMEKEKEMLAERRRHDEEMMRLRQENATRMREAALERYKLLQQIDSLANGSNNSELAVMAAQYKEEADRLRQRLQDAESSTAKLQQELNQLKSAADKVTRERRLLALTPTTPGSGGTPSVGWYSVAPPGTTWVVAVKQE